MSFWGRSGAGTSMNRQVRPFAYPHAGPVSHAPCPYCSQLVLVDDICCGFCGRYINQVTALGQSQDLIPRVMIHSADRRFRFDALWRLVLSDQPPDCLAIVWDAVREWGRDERLLALRIFHDVDDRRAHSFFGLMECDADPGVRALARRERLRLQDKLG